jgi:exportin-2 (importin alpha re-exporter)
VVSLNHSVLVTPRLTSLSWSRPATFNALVKLFSEPQYLTKDKEEDPDAGLTAIDYEEQNAGYQAAYSRLAASETVVTDPVAYVRDPQDFLGQQLVQATKADPRVKQLLTADPGNGPFVQALVSAGYSI